MGVAMNQSFAAIESAKNDPATILKEKNLAREGAKLKLNTAKEDVEKRNKALLADSTIDDKTRAEDKELGTLKAQVKQFELEFEATDKEANIAWDNAHTILATASRYATGLALGAFFINKFELTGATETFVKYGSLATVVAATVFVVSKTYEYFFEEEVDEEFDN